MLLRHLIPCQLKKVVQSSKHSEACYGSNCMWERKTLTFTIYNRATFCLTAYIAYYYYIINNNIIILCRET